MKLLVVNCGSSSIKYRLYEMPQRSVLAQGLVERIGEEESALEHEAAGVRRRREISIRDHHVGMQLLLEQLTSDADGALERIDEIAAVGHRVVHGGEAFSGSVLIDDRVLASIEQCAELAPLHNPANLTGIRAAQVALPGVPQVACFDTAFHATIPPTAHLYALPYDVYERFRVRRYGFHGTSHRYVADQAATMLGKSLDETNLITCHLGNGCSMAAIAAGRSVDTSMGLTPLEGLVMGTRCGDIDPALLFFLAGKGYTTDQLNTMCNKQSGLLGVSGASNDFREVRDAAALGDERARLAIDMFCYRIKKYVGAYTAVLGRVDAVVFTGGIGEHAADVRSRVCEGLDRLGILLDDARNAAAVAGPRTVSRDESPTRVLVIPTDEEGVIAADAYELVSRGA